MSISADEVKKVLAEVYKLQGYIVIGQPSDVLVPMHVGDRTAKVFQFDLGTPFILTHKAQQNDWNKQNDLIAKLRPEWRRLPNATGGSFFKITPISEETLAQVSA